MPYTGTQPVVHQIGPVMWKSAPDDPLSRQGWRDVAERRAILMAEFPRCFEEAVELADAEEAYQTVKNTKKSHPPVFYAARNRLYTARHAVNAWMQEPTGFSGHTPQKRNHELVMAQYQREAQAKYDAFYEATAFTHWLRDQVNHHFIAKRHPERIEALLLDRIGKQDSMRIFTQPNIQLEIAERYRIYADLWRTLQDQGVEAAIRRWQEEVQEILAQAAWWNYDEATVERPSYDDHGKRSTFEKNASGPILPRDLRTTKANG